MLAGENSRRVVDRVKDKLDEIQKTLPEGVTIEPFYDRAHLIEKTIATVLHNLAEGGVLVIVVLLVLLGNLRGGPDRGAGDPAVDALRGQPDARLRHRGQPDEPGGDRLRPDRRLSVIVIENCVRRLSHDGGTRPKLDVIRDAARRGPQAGVFGELIITLVHLPILALQGVEGKLFRPMALTVIFALTGSLLLSLTLMPVLASFGLRPKAEREGHLADPRCEADLRAVLDAVDPPPGARGARWRSALVAASVPVAHAPGRRVHAPSSTRGTC